MNGKPREPRWYFRFSAMIVGAVLVRSAVIHLENSYAFLGSIYAYDLVGARFGVFVAALTPSLQLTLGLMLLFFDKLRRFSICVSATLFLVFFLVQLSTLARGLNISCGCFGSSLENPIGWQSVSMLAALVITSVVSAFGLRSSLNDSSRGVDELPA